MKKIVFIILLFCSFQSFGQNRFPSVDSLQNYILRYIRNSTLEAFSNYRMQNTVYGITEFLDSAFNYSGVDSIWIVDGGSNADTLRFRKWGVTYTAGLISGGGGGTSYTFNNGVKESAGAVTAGGRFNNDSVSFISDNQKVFSVQVKDDTNSYAYSQIVSNHQQIRLFQQTTPPIYRDFTVGLTSIAALNISGSNYSELFIGTTQGRISTGASGTSAAIAAYSDKVEIQKTYSITYVRFSPDSLWLDLDSGRISLNQFESKVVDTTNYKPVAYNPSTKRMVRLQGWPTGSGGVPYTLINGATNLGSGSQVFKDTSSNKINLRSLTAGWGLDVTQNTNDNEYKVDSNEVASKARVKHVADSLGYIISGESVAWGTYAQRVALTNLTPGQRFYQTNERVGEWKYDGSQWIHYPPVSELRQSAQSFPGALSSNTSGTGAAASYGTNGASFKMSGGFLYVATGTTNTGNAAAYATRTNVIASTMPADSADNGYKMVLVGKVALYDAPTAGEDFRFNFGTRNAFASIHNDSTGYGYSFSIANYRNSTYIECYTAQRGGSPVQVTTTSVPITSALYPPVAGYPTDNTSVSEGYITFVLVYNSKHCDYYINGTLVASHTLVGTRANDQGNNDWIVTMYKRTGTTSRLVAVENIYSYYIKDNF